MRTKVTTGVFIPGEFLSQADITEEDIEAIQEQILGLSSNKGSCLNRFPVL